MTEPALAVENLNVYYGESHILRDVDLEVRPGQVICLMGRNGVGKTTLLKTVMGLLPARSGRVMLGEREVTRELPFRRLIAVFQPHRYSRTSGLLDEFATSFDQADAVLVTDIYAAGEDNPTGISGAQLAMKMRNARFTPDFGSVREALEDLAGSGDLVLFMGAGDIWKLGRELAQEN